MNSDIDSAKVPDGVTLYDWEDHDTNRKMIYDDVLNTVAKLFAKKEYNGVLLSITNLKYTDPEHYSIKDQKKALHEDSFLARRLKGTVTLTDSKTGEVLDQKKSITLMKVPYLTGRGTFIREGNEWGTINLTRLLPGAYSRYQNNGDLETLFNVRPGTGGSFKVSFNPESAVYKFKTAGQEFHMYSLMHILGVSDEEMKNSWGEEIFEKNKAGYDSRTLEKAYNKIVPEWDRKLNPGRSDLDKLRLIKNALDRALMTTQVAKVTLPNLFDRTKSASWELNGYIMSKCASFNKEELVAVALYINNATNQNINIEGSKDDIELQIKNLVTTGSVDGTTSTNSDPIVEEINKLKQQKAFEKLKKELEQQYGY